MGLAVKKMVERGYKETEVGVVPEDWEVVLMETLGSAIIGLTYSPRNVCSDGILVHRSSNIQNNQLSYSDNVYVDCDIPEKLILRTNDILICVRNGSRDLIGKSALISGLSIGETFGAFMSVFRTDGCAHLIYQLFISNIIQRQINESLGATINQITNKTINSFKIPLPPTKAEQTAIANALSDADALINSLEKLIEKKRAIKQGAMQELLRPKEGWVVKRLGEIAKVEMGQSPASKFYNKEGRGLPLIQGNADVENRRTIIRSYTSHITKMGRIGEIILSVRAPVGEVSRAMFDCCLGRGVCSILYKNEYLYHYLIFLENSWSRYSTGSTFDSVNSTQVNNLEINMPYSEKEQLNIAEILSNMDSEIESLESKLSKQKLLKQAMMQELLTGKTRLI